MRTLDARRRAIAASLPFSTWPKAAILRLARSARVQRFPRGAIVLAAGRAVDALLVVCEGTVQASVTGPGGKRVAFKLASAGSYGLLPLLDRRMSPNDVIAIGPVVALAVRYAALRAELSLDPSLWESIAAEMVARARGVMEQMKRFVFDPPYLHMAALLVELAETGGGPGGRSATVELRLPQERLGEMLGVSRQWATGLVRQMTREGLVGWRYGRVTLLDLPRLRALARQGVNS